MRLIDTNTGKFVEFFNAKNVPRYAILSHTWDKKEQTYQDVLKIQEKYGLLPAQEPSQQPPEQGDEPDDPSSHDSEDDSHSDSSSDDSGAILDVPTPVLDVDAASGSRASSPDPVISPIWNSDSGLSDKVRKACEVARRVGYRYIWIDSCCINKESSSELSEAINSMYNWYRDADVCYAFLADVPSNKDVRKKGSKFRKSRWFKRGWTLQELVAPLVVVFLSKSWQCLGSKMGLADLITEITSIDVKILTHARALSEESVANRMRWAARRETTRVEDQAYSLLGIFVITMPTLYGEGANAFRRLQEQILERIPDHSIFVWGRKDAQPFPVADPEESSSEIFLNAECPDTETLLAPSPHSFGGHLKLSSSQQITRPTEDSIRGLKLPLEEYTRTPYGVRTQLCLLPLEALNPNARNQVDHMPSWYLVVLRSQYANDRQRLFCRLCYKRTHDAQVESLYLPSNFNDVSFGTAILDDLFTLPIYDISRIQKTLKQPNRTVYLPHPELHDAKPYLSREVPSGHIMSLSLPTCASAVLQAGRYTVTKIQSSVLANDDPESSFAFMLSNATFKIHIHYRYIKPKHRKAVAIVAQVWILSPGEEVPGMDTHFQSSPPYASVTWADDYPWIIILPTHNLHLIMDSGRLIILQLSLRLIAPLQYNIYVDVGPCIKLERAGAPFYPHLKELPLHHCLFDAAHKALHLILTGSARGALNSKGYSAHLVLDPSLRGSYGSHTLTLTSNHTSSLDNFAIVVKYFHAGQGHPTFFNPDSDMDCFLIVARVTLESSDMSLKTVQDGPYFVQWLDSKPWKWRLEQTCVVLTTPTGTLVTLRLGLDLAWKSEYHLNVDIKPVTPSPTYQKTSPMQRNLRSPRCLRNPQNWGHDSIRLTLSGDDRRVLQAQEYQVDFEALHEGDQSDGGVSHRLTLSHIDVTIIIEYFHKLTPRYPEPDDDAPSPISYPFFVGNPGPQTHLASGLSAPTAKAPIRLKRYNQELTFQASVQTLPFCRVHKGPLNPHAVQSDNTTSIVEWDAKGITYFLWSCSLGSKNITITLPSGYRLMLRLDLHFGWFSEYYLTVEIDPLPPLPCLNPSQSNVDAPPVPDSELDATGMDDTPQPLAESPGGGQSAEAHDDPAPGDPQTRITTPGSLVESQEGAAGGGVHDPDSSSDEEPLPAGPSAIEGSQGGSTEPELVDVADDEPLPVDSCTCTTPAGSLTGDQEHTAGSGGGGAHGPMDLPSSDGPLPVGPSTIEGSHRVWNVEPDIVESPALEKRPQSGTEVVARGDAEHVSTHPAQTQSGMDKRRAGARARRYGAKFRRMAQGACETIHRGIRLLKGQTRL